MRKKAAKARQWAGSASTTSCATPQTPKNPDAAFGVVGRMSLDDLVACPVVCATEETEIKASEENAPCDEEIFVLEGCEPTTEEEKIALAEKQAVDEYEKGGDL